MLLIGRAAAGWWPMPARSNAPRQGPALLLERILLDDSSAPMIASRTYRADAVITLLTLPIFSRAGVGMGSATIRGGQREEGNLLALSFEGGSQTERAHGLNRLGFIQEAVLERDSTPVEAAYFGFMTTSPEESIAEGRKALNSGESPGNLYSVVQGRHSAGTVASQKTRIFLAGNYSGSHWRALLKAVRSAFVSSKPEISEQPAPASSIPSTFLYLMSQAVRQTSRRFDARYFYNGKEYRLRIDKTADAHAGAAFAAKGLIRDPNHAIQMRGQIDDLVTGGVTHFRLWTEGDGTSILPIRIELQPRSFLRLAFEFDPSLENQASEESLA